MEHADFLFPTELQVTPTPIKNVLVVGSCLAETLVRHFIHKKPAIRFDYLLFNNAAELPEKPPLDATKYDFQYLQIPLRTVLSDRIVRYVDFCSDNLHAELIDNAYRTLDIMLDTGLRYARRDGLPTFVASFIVPQRAPSRSLKDTASSLSRLVRELNDQIHRFVANEKNVYVLDLDEVASAFGKVRINDDFWHIYSHAAPMPNNWSEGHNKTLTLNAPQDISDILELHEHQFYSLLWQQVEAAFRTIRQVDQVKLVIFDLDNTLWRGLLAEDYDDGFEWPSTDGWPEGLVEAVHHLRARGILVALCSRNDLTLVEKRWSRVMPRALLSLDDFVVIKINFQPKAENVEEIMREVSLTSKSVVFVDDNPVERDDVSTSFPGIRTIGANQFLSRRILLWSAESQSPIASDESKAREGMVRKQIEREHERSAVSREQFLENLNCKVSLFRLNDTEHPRFARCFELLNKTNQFNTTGKRWSSIEMKAFFGKGGAIYAFTAADKFVEYGLVGVVLVQNRHFEQYVLSCRILGLDIETSVVNCIMAELSPSRFTAKAIKTEANLVSRDIFERCGFKVDDAGQYWFEGTPAASPAHLTISFTR